MSYCSSELKISDGYYAQIVTERTFGLLFCVGVKLCLSDCGKKEHTLRMSEDKVLRGVFGPESEEVAGDWRRLHNEELHNLSAPQNIVRVTKLRRTK
jgi:hypothetical protein